MGTAMSSTGIAQRALVFCVVLAVGWLLHLLGPILTPFLVGMALAYLWDPTVDRLQRVGVGRTLAVCAVFLLMVLLLVVLVLVLVPLLGRQMLIMAAKVPVAVQWFHTTLLPWLQQRFGIGAGDLPIQALGEALVANWQSASGFAQRLLSSATASSLALLAWLANLVLIPVVTFYLLRDWDELLQRVHDVLPRAWEATAVQLARECDEVVSAFIRGQLLVMLALGACYTFGLMLIGLDLALLIGLLAGLASIVPYLGLVLGMSAAAIAALLQFGDWLPLLWVFVVFGASQLLEGMYLTPRLVGDRIGLHPVVVIFAVMAGGQLFGFTGVLLALPVSAVIMVLLRHVNERYRASVFYGTATLAAAASPAPAAPGADGGVAPSVETADPLVAPDAGASEPRPPETNAH